MDQPSSAPAGTAHPPDPPHPVNTTPIAPMAVERDDQEDAWGLEAARGQRAEQRRKIKLAMLMQQLEFVFYALVVLCYSLDGKNLIFILRTVSEVQFSQPKQIQPDRPLRFFALASFAICFCALSSHLGLIASSSNYTPSGILVDFIGQFTWNHPVAIVAFLLGLDVCSCLVQLLLVLISFTQSHSISISLNTVDTYPHGTSTSSSPDDDDIEANQPSRKTGELDQAMDPRKPEPEPPNAIRGEETRRLRSHSTRVADDSADFQEDSFLFDLTLAQVKALLFSTAPPAPTNPSATASSSVSPTSTPRPSRPSESAHLPAVLPDNAPENHVQSSDPHLSPALPFVAARLPSRTVVIPITL